MPSRNLRDYPLAMSESQTQPQSSQQTVWVLTHVMGGAAMPMLKVSIYHKRDDAVAAGELHIKSHSQNAWSIPNLPQTLINYGTVAATNQIFGFLAGENWTLHLHEVGIT
jgi:hypothetical protein